MQKIGDFVTHIKETCIYVKDIERSFEFYFEKLGFSCFSKVKDRHVFFKIGSTMLLCFNPEATKNEKELPPHFAHGPQHIAFEVNQKAYNQAKQQIKNLGIVITHEASWGQTHRSFYFEDPDGNVLEIVPAGMWD